MRYTGTNFVITTGMRRQAGYSQVVEGGGLSMKGWKQKVKIEAEKRHAQSEAEAETAESTRRNKGERDVAAEPEVNNCVGHDPADAMHRH